VLGREDLHRAIEGKRRPDGVRPDLLFAAQAAGQEAGLGSGLDYAGMSLAPQQQTLGVAEHREVTGVLGDIREELTYPWHDRHQRMRVQPLLRLVLVEHALRWPLGIDAGLDTARPRPHDHVPKDRRRPTLRERHLVRTVQKAGPRDLGPSQHRHQPKGCASTLLRWRKPTPGRPATEPGSRYRTTSRLHRLRPRDAGLLADGDGFGATTPLRARASCARRLRRW
jgi:hypothetical protein